MAVRSRELIKERRVCDSQEIYADPGITTVSAARAIGDTVCPLLGPCGRGEFDRRGTRCAAAIGQVMAEAVATGSTYEAELAELRNAGLLPPRARGFVDPDTGNPNETTLDRGATEAAILKWAVRISGIEHETPEQADEVSVSVDPAIQRLLDEDRHVTVMPNGISERVSSDSCRCPIIRVGDFCPVHNG